MCQPSESVMKVLLPIFFTITKRGIDISATTKMQDKSMARKLQDIASVVPSAHRQIFCRKQLREKVGVKVRYFIGESQRTRTDFLSQTKHRTYLTIFIGVSFGAHDPIFLSELLCLTMAGKVPLLDYVTSIFYRTEVSTHELIFLS